MSSDSKSILFIGGGYTSCCLARLLTNQGHVTTIFEQTEKLGGMAKSYQIDGMTFELGPHILANHGSSQKSIDFITKYIKVLPTSIDSATFIEGKFLNYPPHIEDIKFLKDKDIIMKELSDLPPKVDETNFETYLISKVGATIYRLYYRNFTKKFWFINPKKLKSSWVRLRHLGESLTDKRMFFHKKWCTYPVNDFNELFVHLTRGIKVKLKTRIVSIDLDKGIISCHKGKKYTADLIVSTLSIDKLLNFKFGELEYSGYIVRPVVVNQNYFHPINPKTGKHFGIVYYPEKKVPYARMTEYKSFNKKEKLSAYSNKTLITIETPSKKAKFYPIMDEQNENKFKLYLKEVSRFPKIITLGRLGLYKYTTLDTTTEQIFHFLDYFDYWQKMTRKERYNALQRIRGV